MIEFLQVLTHFIEHVLHRDVNFFHDALVDVSDYLLYDFKLLEQFATGLQDILRENILLAVDPQIRESFLR